MVPCYEFVEVDRCVGGSGRGARWDGRGLIGFEDIEASELLIDDREGLEALGFEDLFVEPCLDFVLLKFREFLVGIVEVS